MPKGAKESKFIPHNKDAQGNLPPIGQGPPGAFVNGVSSTSNPTIFSRPARGGASIEAVARSRKGGSSRGNSY